MVASNKFNIKIVIPSYNESESLPVLIKGIEKALPDSEMIIVDDSNQEENFKIRKLVKKHKKITLISRKKKDGRGSAVILGFKKAIKDKKTDYLFEMDSDLAHDPKEFSRFLNEIKVFPYDLIIGSRYKSGGKIVNIAANRTIMSRIINNFLYIWLGIKISDYTSGFRLYSRRAAEFIIKARIQSKGFITLSEVAYRIYKKGFAISEVPITWNYRLYGKSNVNLRELMVSLLFVFKLKFISK